MGISYGHSNSIGLYLPLPVDCLQKFTFINSVQELSQESLLAAIHSIHMWGNKH